MLSMSLDKGDVLEVAIDGMLSERAAEYLACDVPDPVSPHYASTVMILRLSQSSKGSDVHSGISVGRGRMDRELIDGVEVFMLQRAGSMAFAPDAVVFPGGGVDVRDVDEDLPWGGPSPAAWAQLMHCDESQARQLVVAAAREMFEEVGVLLAGPDETSVVCDVSGPEWLDERRRLASHERSFASMLIRQGLVLRSDLLKICSNWLTPEFEPRRYDTFFFAALLPEGQVPDGRTSEAVRVRWVKPQMVLDEGERGTLRLLPPTRYNLSLLTGIHHIERFMAEEPMIERIMLSPAMKDDGVVVLRCVLP